MKKVLANFVAMLLVAGLQMAGGTNVRAGDRWLGTFEYDWMGKLQGELPVLGGAKMQLAQADASDTSDSADAEKATSPECLAMQQDIDADIGDIMRAGCEPSLAQMSKLMDNPLGNVAMWINQFDYYRMRNDQFDREDDQYNYMGILQFPKSISKDWNLINRVVYNITSVPVDQGKVDAFKRDVPSIQPPGGPQLPGDFGGAAPIDFIGGRETGFGDMYYVGLFSPKEAIKHEAGGSSVWGVGADLAIPTASEDVLGSGKWSAGPSALYAYLGPKWKLGALWQQYFSFAGDSDRADVNMTNLQYFWYYSIDPVTSIGAMPNILINWEQSSKSDRATVPIGVGINRTFQFGKLPVRIGLEFHYSVIRPNTLGSEYNVRFFIIPAVPAALIPGLQ